MAAFGALIQRFCTSSERRFQYVRLAFVVVLGTLVYSNTFDAPFSFDDTPNLHDNPVIQTLSLDGIKSVLQSRRAFGIVTFQLNYFLSGWNLFGFHLTNLSIHLAAGLTTYALLRLLFQTPYVRRIADAELAVPLPFFTALLFVVHPLQTQAVTYIVQRFASLATLLYLVAVVAYLKVRLTQEVSGSSLSWRVLLWSVVGLVAAGLAFMTKETAYTLPVALLMVELLFFKFSWVKSAKIVTATLLTGAGIVGMLVRTKSLDTVIALVDETTRVQTITSRSEYLFTQFRVIITYIRLIFLPINQSIDYDYVLSHSLFEWRVICSLLVLLLLFATAFWLIVKSRFARPEWRFAAFGILWFFVALSIESSVLPIIDLIFEHRVYLPSIGAFTAITAGTLTWWRRGEAARQRICLAVMLVVFLLGVTAWHRNSVWQSEISLWEDATRKNPHSARGWNNLGGAYIKKQEARKALQALTRSIELDPSKADAWNNVGIAIDMMGVYNDRFRRTAEMFRDPAAVEDKIVSTWLGEVNNNLGLAYEILGNLPKAAESYRNAVGYNPALGLAYYNLGIVSAARGDIVSYAEQLQILRLVDPVLAERMQLRTGVR